MLVQPSLFPFPQQILTIGKTQKQVSYDDAVVKAEKIHYERYFEETFLSAEGAASGEHGKVVNLVLVYFHPACIRGFGQITTLTFCIIKLQ